jgi:photosystem II stability/assembly factor-like uncharacterized protein
MAGRCKVQDSPPRRLMPAAFCLPLLAAGLTLLGAAPAPLAADVGRWSALGPYGGPVAALAVDPAHPAVVYAAAMAGGGIFKSTDGGATWAQVNHGLPLGGFQSPAVVIDPLQPTTLYLGSVNGFGVYKSVDGGASWVPPGPGLQGARGQVSTLAVDPRHSGTVYAGTEPGLDKTADGGATWATAQNGIPGGSTISAIAVDPSLPNTIYAWSGVGENGIFKTTDGGGSWVPVSPETLGSSLAVDPANSQIVYAGSLGGVFKSTDGGKTWNPSRSGMGQVQVTALALAPSNPHILYAGTTAGVFRSNNNAASWVSVSQGLIEPRILALAVDPQDSSTVYSSSQGEIGGVFKTTNGGASWSATYLSGLSAVAVGNFAVNPLSPATIYATGQGQLLMTVNGGATWAPATGLTTGIGAIVQDPSAPQTLYATGSQCDGSVVGALCRSLDGGATWSLVATPVSPTAIAVDPTLSADLYLASATGFWRSTDGGATWTAAAGDISGADLAGIAVDPRTPGTLYAFGEIPNGPRFVPPAMARLYKSTDRGITWTQIQGGLANLAVGFVAALALDPNTSALYVIAGGEVQKSLDGGATWSVIYAPPDPVNSGLISLAVAPGQPATLYVPHGGTLLATSNGGATWQTINAPGLAGGLGQLIVDPQNPRHLLATAFVSGIESLTLAAPAACVPGATALCLGNGRFKVETSWVSGQAAGVGQAVALTEDTGYFWFFAASNLELVVKVLDGCALNGNYWFFAGGLTNVQVSLEVTDTQGGTTEIYTSPNGTAFPPTQDTGAFTSCP